MTGQNLWTAKGDARIDISAINEFLKATVAEARVVADERGVADPKKYVSCVCVCVCVWTIYLFLFFILGKRR